MFPAASSSLFRRASQIGLILAGKFAFPASTSLLRLPIQNRRSSSAVLTAWSVASTSNVISFRVYNGHVLICECKFWKGAKPYSDAINQLFGYLTWRQNYGVLIHFCTRMDLNSTGAGEGEAIRASSESAIGFKAFSL